MLQNRWKMFTGFLAIIVALMVLAVPSAMAKGPNGQGSAGAAHPVARMLMVTAAEEIGITPQELLAELRAGDDVSIADVANAHNINPDNIVDAVIAKATERLAKQVDNGNMTQDEADEKLAKLEEKVTEFINNPTPAMGKGPRDGQQVPLGGRILLVVAADEMGITPRELLAELREGAGLSIADVAEAHNVDPDTIVDAVVAKATERLAEQVENGNMTQDEAAEKLAKIKEKVAEMIEKPFPSRSDRPGNK